MTIFCFLAVTDHVVYAQTMAVQGDGVTLVIKPNICIAPRGESQCISRIDISWSSPTPADYCLHVNTQLLQCWEQAQKGEFQHKIAISENLSYWVTHLGIQQILAQSTVKFAALKPHRKQMRRRSRLPWSIQSL